jgi:hypothetical protein
MQRIPGRRDPRPVGCTAQSRHPLVNGNGIDVVVGAAEVDDVVGGATVTSTKLVWSSAATSRPR